MTIPTYLPYYVLIGAIGIIALAIVITTGFITSPSTLFSYEPPNTLIAIFPLVLIPVYLVPFSVLLHLASLAKLHGGEQEQNRDGLNMRVFGCSTAGMLICDVTRWR